LEIPQTGIDLSEIQQRKDAEHAPRGGGQDGQPGAGCWSLPVSSARADTSLSDRRRKIPGVHDPLAEQGRELPGYVQSEFEDYLNCGRLEHGFLRVLGIVYRVIATHLVRKAGYTHDRARTGAVTLIQRFGSALNLNIHFHMLFLDGVYVDHPNGTARFHWVKAPTSQELIQLAHTIAHRADRFLERQGLLQRDMETT
jgi:hypothetical protein